MAAIVIDEGLAQRMANFSGASIAKVMDRLRLYTAITPALSKDTLLAHFTQVGAGVMGYAEKVMSGADWSYAIDTANHWCVGQASYVWTFTAGAGLTILGWYVLNLSGGKCFTAEQFASPVVIPTGGGSLTLTILDKYKDCV
jgi:hypothetical protein